MAEFLFLLTIVMIAIIGIISFILLRMGKSGITDKTISILFNYITALVVSLMAVSLLFVIWVAPSEDAPKMEESPGWPITYLFLASIFAIVLGSSFAVKRIGDLYGFQVNDTPVKKPKKQKT
jgi:cytochrome bd-type quinol oxidase subunit 2